MKTIIVTLVLVAGLTACGGGKTVEFVFMVTDSDIGPNCSMPLGYGDISSGMPLTVTNEDGKTIGSGSLSVDRDMTRSGQCVLTAEVDVADAEFYSFTAGAGRRGTLTYSKAEMADYEWSVFAVLGR
jgi:hypothetical protein